MKESTKHLLKTGYLKECHDATLCECILNHGWEELIYERLSGEEYQMYLYACRDSVRKLRPVKQSPCPSAETAAIER